MIPITWLLVGVLGALGLIATIRVKPENESQILAIGLVVAALIYIGFALIGDAGLSWIATEVSGVAIYGFFAVLGLCHSKWWFMLGWLAHPIWDVWLHFVGSGVMFTPIWYSSACVSFDLFVAAYIFYTQVRAISVNNDGASRITSR
jgi:hypothetical protein